MSRTLRARSVVSALVCGQWVLVVALSAAGGCSQNKPAPRGIPDPAPASGGAAGTGTGTGGNQGTGLGILVGGGPSGGASAETGPCEGLECQKPTCTYGACVETACLPGELTTVSGTVYEPAGKIPLYNVMVYVPNTPVTPFTEGATCDRCGATIESPVASALTDTAGNFVLEDMPAGVNIPLVIQIGKWRRQITIPAVTRCTTTPLTDINQTRLPRNKTEGDIPLIAIATGGADSMECLPRRMGIEDAEFTTGTGTGRIHLYGGLGAGNDTEATTAFAATLNAGEALASTETLWSDVPTLSRYDIVILSCEGDTNEQSKPVASRQALYDYASLGGRVFASHWHHIWFSGGPAPVPDIGTWSDREDPQDPATGIINTAFPKGADFASWLVNVGASTTMGELSIRTARDNIQVVNDTHATTWITIPQNEQCAEGCDNNDDTCVADCTANPAAIEYVSFNTPLGIPEEEKCGRAVYTDLHVSEASALGNDTPGLPFPEGCQVRDLSEQEKAVMFMLFDLSSCVQDDDDPPIIPK